MMAENAEKQDYWGNFAKEGQDDLLAELDELEAESAEQELQAMDLGPQKIKINKPPVKVVEEQKEEEDEDEVELRKLMMS